jgi:hypothetical protein
MRRRATDSDFDASQPALVVTYGSTTHRHWPLNRETLLLGRGHECDIPLLAPEIGPVHCLIYREPGGWSIRDCGSRAGTHVNGTRIEDVPLRDGDTVQVGSFCFRAHLPPEPAPLPAAQDERAIRHLLRSRRNLVQLALSLRRRLREGRRQQSPPADEWAAALQERLRECDERAARLAQAERELAADREILEEEFRALQQRVAQAEEEIARRQAEVEAELQARWRQMQRLREEAEKAPLPAAGARELDLRRQELAHYAHYLRRMHQRLREAEEELVRRQQALGHDEEGPETVRRSTALHRPEWGSLHPQSV